MTASSGDVLEKLKDSGGFLPFNDKSAPDEIRNAFGMSKKTFKQVIGGLYRQKHIRITDKGIELISN